MPSRQPDYRHNRPHREFLTNVQTDSARLKLALRQRWGATESLRELPEQRIHDLVRDVYASQAWTLKF
jgi:lipoate-protein ligase A